MTTETTGVMRGSPDPRTRPRGGPATAADRIARRPGGAPPRQSANDRRRRRQPPPPATRHSPADRARLRARSAAECRVAGGGGCRRRRRSFALCRGGAPPGRRAIRSAAVAGPPRGRVRGSGEPRMTPVVSVVVPVYNDERFLREAIDSILAQTCRDFEFIVIDDGSTDESPSIVASYTDPRIRLIRTGAQSGVAAALNAGIRAASSDLIARQDADDVSEATRLERQIAAFRARPQLALLGTQATIVDASGAVRGRTERSLDVAALRWYALLDNPFIHTSVMIRRDVVDACGGYP